MSEQNTDHSSAVAQFVGVTGADAHTAEQHLAVNQWNVEAAVQDFFASLEEDAEEDESGDVPTPAMPRAEPSGARTLDGRPAPVPSVPTSSSSAKPPPKKSQPNKKFSSLRDLMGDTAGQDDDSDKEQEYFAGGDKSALAVQDPSNANRDPIQRLIDTARRHGPPPPREVEQQTNFTGSARTLGGDDVESRVIPDPTASTRRAGTMVERTLHLWNDGFSVDDGPLYRYDDPNNARTLEMINRGSAPLDIMNVERGQAVDVKLEAHRGEDYVQPKKQYKAFSGGGQRLGSPVPGVSGTSTTSSSSGTPVTAATASPSTTASSAVEINESEPTVMLQVRLADGTRLPSRFNTSHTVGDVYTFVSQATPGSAQRPYALATTFPTKELSDKSQVLGEMAEFKRGGVVVQKWA